MMPIDPAKEVRIVLPFLVKRLRRESLKAVKKDIEDFLVLRASPDTCASSSVSAAWPSSSAESGIESERSLPSSIRMIRVEYASASSGLWVTIMTKRSRATSFKISITCTLVSVSSAPVGSSAKMISGSLTRARAMATLCICPPESSAGRFES